MSMALPRLGPLLALIALLGGGPLTLPAAAQGDSARQVTLFGVLATPGPPTVDQPLANVAPQLRKLFPGHGFKLLGTDSKRLISGQSVACRLGGGWVAATHLVNPLDTDGKVQLRFALEQDGRAQYQTLVTTPPNQLFFCDKTLPDGSRLVVGIGAR